MNHYRCSLACVARNWGEIRQQIQDEASSYGVCLEVAAHRVLGRDVESGRFRMPDGSWVRFMISGKLVGNLVGQQTCGG